MPLTQIKIQSAKPKEKPYKLWDSGGLYLLVTPTGGKCWRFKYRLLGKEKVLSFGLFPRHFFVSFLLPAGSQYPYLGQLPVLRLFRNLSYALGLNIF